MRKTWQRADAFQRQHRAAGVPIGVIYKFLDDQGSFLAAALTYYAFTAIFPLLLIASSVLGFVLESNPGLKAEVLTSALRQFPIIGTQLGQPAGLHGSTLAIAVGLLAALYGTNGLGQAAQNTLNTTMAIPRNSRSNPIVSRLHNLALLFVGGLAVLAIALATTLASQFDGLGIARGAIQWLLPIPAAICMTVALAVMISITSSRRQSLRQALPGAILIAVLWQLLQDVGGAYVQHVLTKVNAMNSTFALVLGLIAFLYLATTVAILGLELNVVLSDHLYPRALATPFTDNVDLTDADRRAYSNYARAQRHKGFERIEVVFDEPD